jgi:septum formation protein
MPLILASRSPRRAELLSAAGYEFDIVPADVDETPRAGETPAEYTLRVARAKAERVITNGRDAAGIVLAADTVVVVDGRMLGKPSERADATAMLRSLSGKAHDVLTAVVVQTGTRRIEEVVTTRVWFQPLSERDIAWYLASGEPEGKAGAYAIQGRAARFIDRIEGSWSNVVGLPVSTVHRLLSQVEAEVSRSA